MKSLIIATMIAFTPMAFASGKPAPKVDCTQKKNANKIECKEAPKSDVKVEVKKPEKVERKAPKSVEKKAAEAKK
jgi:hypothetical protein